MLSGEEVTSEDSSDSLRPSWKTKAVLWQASLRQAVIPYFSPHIKPSPCFLLHISLLSLFHQKLTASSCIMHWQRCSPCQRAIAFAIESLIGVWESGGATGGGGPGDFLAEVLSEDSDGALVQMTSQRRAHKVWREAQASYHWDRKERHTEPFEAVA